MVSKFHGVDFIKQIYNYPLDQEVIYEDLRSDEIIENLLGTLGLVAGQYNLDIGMNVISFAYFPQGSKIGEIIKMLTEAELGMFYEDEAGVLQFANRERWTKAPYTTSRFTFTTDNCIDIYTPTDEHIVNVVEVFAQRRAVQPQQFIYNLGNSVEVPAGGTVDVFCNFKDDDGALPVTSVQAPVYSNPLGSYSSYSTNTLSDGSGSAFNSFISVSSTALFSTAYRVTFANAHTSPLFITAMEIYGTPATVVEDIYERNEDAASVANYGERPVTITNNYIQSSDFANSIGRILLSQKAELETIREVLCPAIPHLQIGDLVTLNDGIVTDTYTITKIVGSYGADGFRNRFTLTQRTVDSYFKIEISLIEGVDKIAP
jgi:hypothetical protein